uniref:BEN domain containing 5 n=1 Tax=Serinus canaria TaxID=9135 RepID=A0A8C9MK29_SERCA
YFKFLTRCRDSYKYLFEIGLQSNFVTDLILMQLLCNDKTDLENSVMQKKIKIPKLSLNHIEEAGEVTDYGEEDVELRHSKCLGHI